jgi:hypothetical protein
MGTAVSFGQRVQEALKETRKFFKDFSLAPEGLIDVFGFSRGAAAARAFVNQLHRIGRLSPGAFGGIALRVRFIGLFDTVGSIGLPGAHHEDCSRGHHPRPLAAQPDRPVLAPPARPKPGALCAGADASGGYPTGRAV